jgi:Fe2+ or Zn2+ uptake regulation protein
LPEAELQPLAESLMNNHKFKADMSHLALFGLCPECQV